MNTKNYSLKIVILVFPLMALTRCELVRNNSTINILDSRTYGKSQMSFGKQQQHQHIKDSKHESDMHEFGSVISEYVSDVLNRDTINILPGVNIERKINQSSSDGSGKNFDTSLISAVRRFTNSHVLTVNLARATSETGRVFFFKGESQPQFI